MFNATLDRTAKTIPYVMAASAIIFLLAGFFVKDQLGPWILSFPSAVIMVVLFGCRAYMPLGYTIDLDHVAVERKIGKFFIPRTEIEQAVLVTDKDLGRTWRMAGNGGVFGYTGWYKTASFGTIRWFVTSREKYVMIVMQSGKKYLLSPDDPKGFIDSIRP